VPLINSQIVGKVVGNSQGRLKCRTREAQDLENYGSNHRTGKYKTRKLTDEIMGLYGKYKDACK